MAGAGRCAVAAPQVVAAAPGVVEKIAMSVPYSDTFAAQLPVTAGWRVMIADAHFADFDWNSWLKTLTGNAAALPGYRVLKQGGDTVVLVTDIRPGAAVVVKFSRRKGVLACLSRVIRHSAEAHEFQLSRALTEAGIATPQPVALLERGGESVLVTRFVGELRDLDQVALVELPRRRGPGLAKLKRGLVEQLALIIAAFHRAGFSHRDLKASNILVQLPMDSSAAPAVWLVDLKGVSKGTSTNAAKELRALARLAASLLAYRSLTRTDYARFLASYMAHMGLNKREWRKLYPTLSRDAQAYNRRAKSRKGGKIDGYGGV